MVGGDSVIIYWPPGSITSHLSNEAGCSCLQCSPAILFPNCPCIKTLSIRACCNGTGDPTTALIISPGNEGVWPCPREWKVSLHAEPDWVPLQESGFYLSPLEWSPKPWKVLCPYNAGLKPFMLEKSGDTFPCLELSLACCWEHMETLYLPKSSHKRRKLGAKTKDRQDRWKEKKLGC